jgi:copper oxidase (laccase) domain-containing protein
MNPGFAFVTHNGVTLLVFRKWWDQGIVHGMTTCELSFSREVSADSASKLCSAIGASNLVVPEQCHGNSCIDMRDELLLERLASEGTPRPCRYREGDALIVPSVEPGTLAFGVLSADCVAVLVRGRSAWAVIHAGWRGLANGVIREAVERLQEPLEAAVFPSAGGRVYEVGRDVVDALGGSAVFSRAPNGGGKILLDTAATAISQLGVVTPTVAAASSGICTISDRRFHSFRRDGDSAGRAVTFVLPPRGIP